MQNRLSCHNIALVSGSSYLLLFPSRNFPNLLSPSHPSISICVTIMTFVHPHRCLLAVLPRFITLFLFFVKLITSLQTFCSCPSQFCDSFFRGHPWSAAVSLGKHSASQRLSQARKQMSPSQLFWGWDGNADGNSGDNAR